MLNYRLCRIDNFRFTVRFCALAKKNNIKTVGKMELLARKLDNKRILKEVTEFKKLYNL